MNVTKNSVVSLRAELSVLLAMFHVKSKANRRDGCTQATQLSSPEKKWMYNKACPTPRRRKRGLWLWKRIKCFRFTLHRRNSKFILDVFEIKLGQGNIIMIIMRNVIFFKKLRFGNVFCPHKDAKSAISTSSGLKGVFGKLRFRDELVWTKRWTWETKLRFKNPRGSEDGG